MKNRKKILLLFTTILVASIIIIYPFRYRIKHKLRAIIGYATGNGVGSGKCYGCSRIFTDNVSIHEFAYADGSGIVPQPDDESLNQLCKQSTLVKLKSNDLFIVRKFEFSKPYILPEGHTFIKTLADLYYTKCQEDKITYVPFTISSVTRTKESVKALQECNPNAIKNSAHLKGKTFDISYKAFNDNKQQTLLFRKKQTSAIFVCLSIKTDHTEVFRWGLK